MKTLYESLLGDMEANVNSKYMYYPKNRDELIEAIKACLDAKVYDLNCINTSKITEMNSIFDAEYGPLQKYKNVFSKIDISEWDTSNVEYMDYMFTDSKFNGDISDWNVSSVTDMTTMFFGSDFNGDISDWNVGNVMCMVGMFQKSKFNKNISKWKVSKQAKLSKMFADCPLEKNPPKWYNAKYNS